VLGREHEVMRFGNSTPLSDPADLRFRVATVKTGCWLTFAMGVFIVLYARQTWQAGHRGAIVLLVACLVLGAIAMLTVVPFESIVAGRWRETFFMSWSAAVIAAVLVAALLDPLPRSPLTLPLFMPLLFAGLSYPVRTAVVVACLVVAGYLVVSLLRHDPLSYSALVLSILVCTACMCLWQAHNRNAQRCELDRQRDQLARASRVDPLTGALNRRGFEERLGAELADASRSGRALTLAMLDLDDFKGVNDRDGHAAGDAVLVLTVERLTMTLRPMDALGRIGGDEFAVVMPDTADTDARMVVARLRAALAGHVPASFGYSRFPDDGVSPEELYRRADEALYAAKRERSRPSRAVTRQHDRSQSPPTGRHRSPHV
jgi:diguanylate cyclase (GGDEF)-like protein